MIKQRIPMKKRERLHYKKIINSLQIFCLQFTVFPQPNFLNMDYSYIVHRGSGY
jgi:hypothetical protein